MGSWGWGRGGGGGGVGWGGGGVRESHKHSCCRKVKVLNILKACLLSWLSYPVCLALQYFSTLSHKRHDFNKILFNIKCIVSFSIQLWNISHSKKTSEWYYHKCTYIGLHVKHPLFLPDFISNSNFSTDLQNILKYQVSWKFVQCEPSCSMRTDGWTYVQTDMITITVAFKNFVNAPKIRLKELIGNIRQDVPDYTALYPRRQRSCPPSREPQISHFPHVFPWLRKRFENINFLLASAFTENVIPH